MNGQMDAKGRNSRMSIDRELNSIEVDLNGIRDQAREINKMLLGSRKPAVTQEGHEGDRAIPAGWFQQVLGMLIGFEVRIKEIQAIQSELRDSIVKGESEISVTDSPCIK